MRPVKALKLLNIPKKRCERLMTNYKQLAIKIGTMRITEGQHITIKNTKHPSESMELTIGHCLRSVPRRRAVYEGTSGGRSVIIKVFLSRVQGWRYWF